MEHLRITFGGAIPPHPLLLLFPASVAIPLPPFDISPGRDNKL